VKVLKPEPVNLIWSGDFQFGILLSYCSTVSVVIGLQASCYAVRHAEARCQPVFSVSLTMQLFRYAGNAAQVCLTDCSMQNFTESFPFGARAFVAFFIELLIYTIVAFG